MYYTTSNVGRKQGIGKHRLLILIFIYMYLNMVQYFSKASQRTSVTLLILNFATILVALFLTVINTDGLRINRNSALWSGMLFFVASGVSTMLNIGNYTSQIRTLLSLSFWMVIFYYFSIRYQVLDELELKKLLKIICIAFWFFAIRYFIWVVTQNMERSGTRNCIYYSLMLLPFAFMMDSGPMKISMITITMINTLLSAKRAAFVVFFVVVLVPILIELIRSNRKRKFYTVAVSAVCLFAVYSYLSSKVEITIFDRFATLEEDGGSGRLDIYSKVWATFQNSSFIHRLLGRGYNAVAMYRVVDTSAHNDYLEVLYDYGYIGLILYLSFLFKMLKNVFRLYAYGSRFASTYLAAVMAYILMSMFSHLILYPTYIVFLLLVFSLGDNDLKRIVAEGKNENSTYKLR